MPTQAPADSPRFPDRRCANILPDLFASGKLKANPIRSFDGGLDNITEGLEYLKAGSVSRSIRFKKPAALLTVLRGQNSGQKVTYKI